MCGVYIPPNRNASRSANLIAECVHHHLEMKPDTPMLILSDFNHCSLNKTLPRFYQNVIQLLLLYRSVLKSNKLETQIVKVWTDAKWRS